MPQPTSTAEASQAADERVADAPAADIRANVTLRTDRVPHVSLSRHGVFHFRAQFHLP
jgi:hypothetical protein